MLQSCAKETQGPKGEQGEPGPAGKTGVNVVSSDIPVQLEDWRKAADTNEWEQEIFFPGLTNDILTKGSVQIYMSDSVYWQVLPFTEDDVTLRPTFSVNKIHLLKFSSHHQRPPKPPTTMYRLVLISGPA